MTSYFARAHSNAWLSAVKAAAAPLLVGDAVAPDGIARDSEGMPLAPYAVGYPLGSQRFDGPAAAVDGTADAWPAYQVTCIGSSREQAEDLRDRIRAALVSADLSVSGRVLHLVQLIAEQAVQRDTEVTPFLFYAVDRYQAFSTPA